MPYKSGASMHGLPGRRPRSLTLEKHGWMGSVDGENLSVRFASQVIFPLLNF